MMGMLMKDLNTKWSRSMEVVEGINTFLTHTSEQLHNLEANFSWKNYTITCGVWEMDGDRNVDQYRMVGETFVVAQRFAGPKWNNQENTQLTH